MATRGLLAELCAEYSKRSGVPVTIEAVGGVDAARRVAADEPFDVVFLAADAIAKLAVAGKVDEAGQVALVKSDVAVAVPAGAPRPDISTEAAVRQAVLAAPRIAYSTGPSATGPWTYHGVIMKKNAVVKTIHHAIIEHNGKSYIFYHNDKLPTGGEFRRSAAVEELHYNPDGTIRFIPQTEAGPAANPSPGCKG